MILTFKPQTALVSASFVIATILLSMKASFKNLQMRLYARTGQLSEAANVNIDMR